MKIPWLPIAAVSGLVTLGLAVVYGPPVEAPTASALADIIPMLLAAQRHRQATIDVAELALALEAVDVEGLAEPRPAPVGGLGDRPIATRRASSVSGEKVAWS